MKRLIFLIIGFLVVFSVSGCMGDKIQGGPRKDLRVTINANKELCFYIDDFRGVDNYYLTAIMVESTKNNQNSLWKIYDSNFWHISNDTKIFRERIKLSSIVGMKNCIPYGTNLSTDKFYKAMPLDPTGVYHFSFEAYKGNNFRNQKWEDMLNIIVTILFFKNPSTGKYDVIVKYRGS